MNTPVLVPIVEGYSEVESIPVLLRRLLAEWGRYEVAVAKPVRVSRYKEVQLCVFFLLPF